MVAQKTSTKDIATRRIIISMMRSGRKQPTVEMLFRLADALEIPASAIISEMEKERQHA